MENPGADKLPGRSFASLLRGERAAGRENVVVFDEYGPVRMVRNKRWKYVHRYAYGPNELYDLANDPGERHNLVREPGHEAVVRSFKAELDEFFAKYVDPRLDGTMEAVYGTGQMGLAGTAAKGGKPFNDEFHYVDEKGDRRDDTYRPPDL
jgi:arylsulfatase A-like enzyme